MDNQLKSLVPDLIEKAMKARTFAYAPYSNYLVGAALYTDECAIFTGCNVENAAYSPGNCAERTAIFKAVSEGYTSFKAIAIVAGPRDAKGEVDYPSPCGVCRQVMREFVDPKAFVVIMAKSKDDYVICTLEELLPRSFGPDYLQQVK